MRIMFLKSCQHSKQCIFGTPFQTNKNVGPTQAPQGCDAGARDQRPEPRARVWGGQDNVCLVLLLRGGVERPVTWRRLLPQIVCHAFSSPVLSARNVGALCLAVSPLLDSRIQCPMRVEYARHEYSSTVRVRFLNRNEHKPTYC